MHGYLSSVAFGLALICLAGTTIPTEGKIDITCKPKTNNIIDWDCIFGEESEEEVLEYRSRDGKEKAQHTSCKVGNDRPCSRFVVPKNVQRAETKVAYGPEGFPFLKGEHYIYKYSFRAVDHMKLSTHFTHIGQIKAAYNGGETVDGDPIVSISANNMGLHVRFSNKESIEDYYTHDSWYRKWEDATGEWVHVTIDTVFGESMEVELAGGVSGKFAWPKDKKPIAWNDDGKMARMKLGLYHKEEYVYDGEVEIRDISIEGPNGIIRTSPAATPTPAPTPVPTPTPPGQVCEGGIAGIQTSDTCCPIKCGTCGGVGCGERKSGSSFTGAEACCESGVKSLGRICSDKVGAPCMVSNVCLSGTKECASTGYTYLGCYEDEKSDRVFGKKYIDAHMTTAMCADLCDYAKYFAMQYGNECWCGSSTDKPTRHGKSKDCTTKCAGDTSATETCGGALAMDLYEHGGKPSEVPTGSNYMGCYADNAKDRALNLKDTSSTKMEYDACEKFCAKEGARYFGVQNGKQCFCGSRKDDYDEHGPGICNVKCAGNAGLVCGGKNAQNVFLIKA